MRLTGLAVILLTALPAALPAATLADRLPQGLAVVAEADFAALRASPLVDRKAWEAAESPSVLESAGLSYRKDVDRVAVGLLPSFDGKTEPGLVAFLSGRFDPALVRKGLVAQGAKPVQVGKVSAWRMAGGTSVSLHPALPGMTLDGDVLVSFLGDVLVLASEQGTRIAHGPRQALPSPALAAARQSVPRSSPAWIAVDLASMRAAGDNSLGNPMLGGLKTIAVWTSLGEALELQALAKAADEKQATQLAGLASLLAGAAASSPEGKALAGLRISANGDAISASLTLTAEQLKALNAQAAAEAATVAAPAAPRSGS